MRSERQAPPRRCRRGEGERAWTRFDSVRRSQARLSGRRARRAAGHRVFLRRSVATRVDPWLGSDATRGLSLFRGRSNCSACRIGPNFTDEQFHNTGVSWGSGDSGRYRVTRRTEDFGRFKTPTLRQLRLTNPYMHDGSVDRLDAVVDSMTQVGTTTRCWIPSSIGYASAPKKSAM